MSGVVMRDSWTIEPPFMPESADHQISTKQWAEAYGLIPRLVTIDQRLRDPIEMLQAFRAGIESRPKTAATIRLPAIEEYLPAPVETIPNVRPFMDILGAWEYDATENSLGRRWVNPNYVHRKSIEPNVTDPDERRAILERLASIGVIKLPDIAPQFGVEHGTIRQWAANHEIGWEEMRLEGVKRMARTCYTISTWGDWSHRELAPVLGVARGTLSRWIHNYAKGTSFEVPEDPSGESWFIQKSAAARRREE